MPMPQVDFRALVLLAVLFMAFLTLASQCSGITPRPLELVPGCSTDVVRTYTLAELTAEEARHLDGKRARFRIVLDSAPDQEGRYTLFDYLAPAGQFS
jgi:hypothetical protein